MSAVVDRLVNMEKSKTAADSKMSTMVDWFSDIHKNLRGVTDSKMSTMVDTLLAIHCLLES